MNAPSEPARAIEPALPPAVPVRPVRLASLDAYRGLVMFLMAAEVLRLADVARHFPSNAVWQWLAKHAEHVEWTGCVLHDLIQPSFSFMVGVALPFSVARRLAAGDSRWGLWIHACWRGLALVLLGVFLRSLGRDQTYWTFEDTLSQIGLGYPLLFALGLARERTRWIALAVILAGYWLLFALWPLPGAPVDPAQHRIPPDWPHDIAGFAAHWNLNTNAAWAFDRWFLNLFPREAAFIGNGGGYSTLSFIPTLGTMLLGLFAGQALLEGTGFTRPGERWGLAIRLALAGLAAMAAGWALDQLGVCPSVKKIWTPSWTLFSGGWCFLFMAAFYVMADVLGGGRLFFPLIVIGMNSIAMYVLVHTTEGFWSRALHTHFGDRPFHAFGEAYAPLLHGGAVLLILWLILCWMWRRKIFLRL
ncbi:MAG: acyltransferase family protein [Verrucomicrobiales bacterium]